MAWFRPKKVVDTPIVRTQPTIVGTRQINDEGLELIKEFEGFYPKAYKCPAGVWTIGIGTIHYPNGESVKRGDTCTLEQAKKYLDFELDSKELIIDNFLKNLCIDVTDNQFSALVSFAYNLGTGIVTRRKYSLGRALIADDMQTAADAILLYNKARVKGKLKKLRGLVRRREAERKLFLS